MTNADRQLFLITGATNGIGKAAAQALAAQGGQLVIVGRNPEKTAATVKEIQQASGNSDVSSLLADLSSMAEVRRLAGEFLQRYPRLDVLINNAGAFYGRRYTTADGLEATFALNHLSYFLLTVLLLPALKASAPSRIVNVSSGAESGGSPNWDDLQMAKKYSGFKAYAVSKRFNLYFTYELARRLESTGVTVNALHPGQVATGIWSNPTGPLAFAAKPLTRLVMRSPEQGAETLVYLATSPEVGGVSGKYFVDKKQKFSSRASQDPEAARRAWQISAQLVGLESET